MWQYDPNVGDMVWVETAGSAAANVPANIASLVPSGGTVQQNMASSLQGYGAEGGEMSFNPDGTYTISTPLADNQFLNTIVDSSGKQISQNVSSGKDTGLQDLAAFAAIPLTAGGAGGLLGGALGLSGTAASALGNALISGTAGAISGQDPLKAALLAAGGTYAGSLFGGGEAASGSTLTDAQFVAADAAQLAAQGLGADQIEQVLRASGVNTVTAVAAADAASSGMNVDQIAKDITLGNRGLFSDTTAATTPTAVTTDPTGLQTVTTTGTAPVVNTGGLLGGLTAAAVPAAVATQPSIVATDLPPVNQQVTITGDQAPASNLGNILATIDPSLISPGVGPQKPVDQVIETTGTKATDTKNLPATITALDTVVSPGPDVGPQRPVDQVIETTGTKNKDNLPATITAIDTVVSPGPDVGPQSGGDVETQDQKDRTTNPNALLGNLTLADILKALTTASSLGLLGGGGGGGGTTTMTPTTPVPVGNADYYKAIQQYYNTYMPSTPRDVATPLQQWYEGKFGG
jgi:hypothetical protein